MRRVPVLLALLAFVVSLSNAQPVRHELEWTHGYTLGDTPMLRTVLKAELEIADARHSKPYAGSAVGVRILRLELDMSGEDGKLERQLTIATGERPAWLPRQLVFNFDKRGKLVDRPQVRGRFAWLVTHLIPGANGAHLRIRRGEFEALLVHDLRNAGSRLVEPAVKVLACPREGAGDLTRTISGGSRDHSVPAIGNGEFKLENLYVTVKLESTYPSQSSTWGSLSWSTWGTTIASSKPLLLESRFTLKRK